MLKLFNTLLGKKQQFKPLETGKVKIYTCGPTVYDYAHIGNLSAYIYADTLRRQLEYLGYEVRHIVNITDVGHLTADDINQADSGQDKMLKAALREKKSPQEIANFYTDCFFQDSEKLGLKKAHLYPRATAHIPQMIKIVETLIEKGLAYEKNGNVFFEVEKFKEYGKLSGKKLDELKQGARLEKHPDKKNPFDFALWLKAPEKHILKWETPWSLGYPGWHIECSAMSMEYLGETLDIHTGGEDHIFPHHENEIAQSEGTTGKPFANFWLHNRFLLVDGEKMSKSKGSFFILKDIEEKGYSPMAFRLLVLGSHYRSNLNFIWKRMEEAQKNLDKISRFIGNLEKLAEEKVDPDNKEGIVFVKYLEKFEKALKDDLNTPLALSALYEMISESNKDLADRILGSQEANSALAVWQKMNKVLGLKLDKNIASSIPVEISELLEKRKKARADKDFQLSDKIRKEIESRGFIVEDSVEGQKIRKK